MRPSRRERSKPIAIGRPRTSGMTSSPRTRANTPERARRSIRARAPRCRCRVITSPMRSRSTVWTSWSGKSSRAEARRAMAMGCDWRRRSCTRKRGANTGRTTSRSRNRATCARADRWVKCSSCKGVIAMGRRRFQSASRARRLGSRLRLPKRRRRESGGGSRFACARHRDRSGTGSCVESKSRTRRRASARRGRRVRRRGIFYPKTP